MDAITEASTTSFEDAREQIDQQLGPQIQQEEFTAFLADYRDRWTEVTICAEDFITERCDNFKGETAPCPDPALPEDQQKQQLEETGCPPPVLPNTPGRARLVRPVRARPGRAPAAAPAR